jgi:hypothetical protein
LFPWYTINYISWVVIAQVLLSPFLLFATLSGRVIAHH